VTPGAEVDLVFSVPNEDDAVGVDHVTLGIPADFELDDGEAKPGWTQSAHRPGDHVVRRPIPKGQFARFDPRGTAPVDCVGGAFCDIALHLSLTPTTPTKTPLNVVATTTKDSSARSLANAALVIAIVAALLALVALFAWVYRWIRPTPG
jgi:uncharacterized protein YcnI